MLVHRRKPKLSTLVAANHHLHPDDVVHMGRGVYYRVFCTTGTTADMYRLGWAQSQLCRLHDAWRAIRYWWRHR